MCGKNLKVVFYLFGTLLRIFKDLMPYPDNACWESEMTGAMQRRDPVTYANILLKETNFSSREIAELCGLDIYQVTALKLKSREANNSCN